MKKESFLGRIVSFLMIAALVLLSAAVFAETKTITTDGNYYCQSNDTDTDNAKEEGQDQGNSEEQEDSQQDYGSDETENSEEGR